MWAALNGIQQGALVAGGGMVLYLGYVASRGWWARRGLGVRYSSEEAGYRQRLAAHARRVEEAQARRFRSAQWEGFRRFVVRDKRWEDAARQVCSLLLEPEDGKPLPDFKPGQFLTFRLSMQDAGGRPQKVVRCYSLSCGGGERPYRVSVKRVPAPEGTDHPDGRASNHIHDAVQVGDTLQVKAPSGKFWLDVEDHRPVVLVGGGIGMTPLCSMMASLVACGSTREVWFFLGMRNGREHPFKDEVRAWAARLPNVHVVVCYSRPRAEDRLGRDYDVAGHVTVDLMRRHLGDVPPHAFFVCGPPPMMESLVPALDAWGIDAGDIHFEAFGPASLRRTRKQGVPEAPAEAFTVHFGRTGVRVPWDAGYENLLYCAEAHAVPLEGGCRAGNCGTCAAVLKEGKVSYVTEPEAYIEPGTCLTCISVPASDVVFDA